MLHLITALALGLTGAVGGLPVPLFTGEFLQWALVFLVLAIVAGLLGARGIAGMSMEIAKWLVIIFIVLAIVTALL